MESKILHTLSLKLGLKSQAVVRKADEYMRLADIRSSSSSLAALNCSGSCKAVMCLELAASHCGQEVDKSAVVRLAGMNKKVYTSALKAMECLLDLRPQVTVPDLVVQFGCTSAKSLALDVLKSYKATQCSEESAEHSQALFNTAAVYTACRKTKNKINKNKLLDTAGVKRSTFDKLVSEMDKHAEKLGADKKVTKGKRSKTFIEELESMAAEECVDAKQKKTEESANTNTEDDYESWKKNILDAAYKALGKPRGK